MMNQSIKFGTDGWRGIIAQDFTFQNVKLVAQAYADFLKRKKKRRTRIGIGYDTRFLSNKFAQAFAEVLVGNGFKIAIFKESLPTPSLCLAIKEHRFSGGIMITASHNPPEFNGIKIKTERAAPALPAQTAEVESLLGRSKIKEIDYQQALREKLIEELDFKKPYLKFLKRYINFDLLKKKKFRVLHDSMYGSGKHLLEEILADSKMKVETLRGEINPSFLGISPEPIPRNLRLPESLMKKGKYDICIITDGDADRIGAIAPGGRFLPPGWIISLLLFHLVKNRKLTGAVVKTVSNSSLIEKIASYYNLKLYETPVGFKYISEIMQKEDVLIGGEESGGIGVKGYIPERDGILSGLLLLEMMAYEDKSLNEIINGFEKKFGKFRYHRIDIRYPDNLKPRLFRKLKASPFKEILGLKVVEFKDYDGMKFILEDGSWILFRLSGTEPILRIYSESSSRKKVQALIEFGHRFAMGIK